MLLNPNGNVDAKSVNASIIALKNRIDLLSKNSNSGSVATDNSTLIDDTKTVNNKTWSSSKIHNEIDNIGVTLGFGEPVQNWLSGHTTAATAITADCDGVLVCSFNNSSFYQAYIVDCTSTEKTIAASTGTYYQSLTIGIKKGCKYYWSYTYSAPSLSCCFFFPFIQNIVRPVDAKDVYSTTETVVGKWIDGKPIYRKVYNNQSVSNPIDVSALNIETMIKLQGMQKNGVGDTHAMPYSENSYYRNIYYKDSDKTIRVGSNGGSGIIWNFIILEYTKTTD